MKINPHKFPRFRHDVKCEKHGLYGFTVCAKCHEGLDLVSISRFKEIQELRAQVEVLKDRVEFYADKENRDRGNADCLKDAIAFRDAALEKIKQGGVSALWQRVVAITTSLEPEDGGTD